MSKIKVLLAEDHTIVRKGLCSLLNNESDIEIVGEAENGLEALEKAESLRPDIVIMDISMPSLNGLEATRRIKKRNPEIKILILTMHTNEEYIFEILQAGASGYLVKKAAPTDMVSAIHAVQKGESFLSPSISKRVIQEYLNRSQASKRTDPYESLTDREREILQLIAEGFSNREIAEQLFISIKTVESHKTHIMEKLELRGTAELTRYAIRKGIISEEG